MTGERRTLASLVVLVVLLTGAHLALDLQRRGDHQLVRRSVLAPYSDEATTLVIRRPGEAPVRLEGGREWRFAEPFAAAAEAAPVRRLLDALAFTPIVEAVSERELLRLEGRTRRDFALEEPRLEIELGVPGRASQRIAFGSPTPEGDAVYAAVAGESDVYVVPTGLVAAVDLPWSAFRDHTLIRLVPDEVDAFSIRTGGDRVCRFKRMGEIWSMVEPKPAQASAAAVKRLFELVAAARAVDFVWPVGESKTAGASLLASYALDPESAVTITFKTRDGVDSTLAFGADAGQARTYALAADAVTIVKVDAAVRAAVVAAPDAMVDTRLFAVEAAAVSTMSFTDADAVYLLSRDGSGAWRLEAPVTAAADQEVAEMLLTRLLSLRSADREAAGVTVGVGTNLSPVVVSRSAAFGGLNPAALRSCEVLKIPAASVRRLARFVKGEATGAGVVFDPDRRVWNVEADGETAVAGSVAADAVEAVLSAIGSLRAAEVVKLKVSAEELADFGLDVPEFTLAVDRGEEDAVRRNILIGKAARTGGRYATVGAADAVFVLSDETVAVLTADLVVRER